MKTTIEIDEDKLKNIMKLCGIKTRKHAVDHALTLAERQARLHQILEKKWTPDALKAAFDPSYDLAQLRELEKPAHGHSH